MSEQSMPKDPGAAWRGQPEEKVAIDLELALQRRTQELTSRTRSEILMSIGAALLLVGVAAWRLPPAHDVVQVAGFAAVVVWVVISLYWFRHRIWLRESPQPGRVAASGLDYYRGELERRRDHLRNAWVWHGPLLLACLILIATLIANSGYQPLRNALPLLALLAVWTAFGVWRRRLQARELQREIDEMNQ